MYDSQIKDFICGTREPEWFWGELIPGSVCKEEEKRQPIRGVLIKPALGSLELLHKGALSMPQFSSAGMRGLPVQMQTPVSLAEGFLLGAEHSWKSFQPSLHRIEDSLWSQGAPDDHGKNNDGRGGSQ